MEKEGHLGTTWLLGAGVILLVGLPEGIAATVIMTLVATIPDQDQYIPSTLVQHRGPTHSVLFALGVAFVIASTVTYPAHIGQQVAVDYGVMSSMVITPTEIWLFLSGAIALSMLGHIATDLLTKGGGYKIAPLWPVSSTTVALGLCTADDERWNAGLLASGITAFLGAVLHEVYQILRVVLGG